MARPLAVGTTVPVTSAATSITLLHYRTVTEMVRRCDGDVSYTVSDSGRPIPL